MKKRTIIIGGLILVCLIIVGVYRFLSPGGDAHEGVTEINYQISKRFLTQPVDHARPNRETFHQEIMILVPDRADSESPVFFILGNESDHTRGKLVKFHQAYGSPDDVIFIQAEHRGYGQSITDGNQSKPGYLRIEQALADYHRVISELKKEFTGPWMAAGYSYGGGLVVHFASLYPNEVKVILASSAVIDWPFFMDQYDKQVQINLGEGLYNRFAAHIRSLKSEKPFDQAWHEREFLTNMAIGMSQYKRYS